MDTANQLKKSLINTSIELILKHHVSQTEIFKQIKDALVDAVKDMKKIPIAYNRCYGDYSVSKHFSQFIDSIYFEQPAKYTVESYTGCTLHKNEPAYCFRDRIRTAIMLPIYGSHMNASFPRIGNMIMSMKNAGLFINIAQSIVGLMKKRDNVYINMETIKNDLFSSYCFTFAPEEKENRYPITEKILSDDYIFTQRYKKSDVKKLLATVNIEEITAQITNEIAILAQDEIWCMYPQQIRTDALDFVRSWTRNRQSQDVLSSFIEAYLSDERDAWVHQNIYPIMAASFLNGLAQEIVNLFKSNVPDLDLDLKVGLLCASTRFSNIQIALVSPHVHFEISEYDGMETVRQ